MGMIIVLKMMGMIILFVQLVVWSVYKKPEPHRCVLVVSVNVRGAWITDFVVFISAG